MLVLFYFIAIFCLIVGIMIMAAPEVIIKINDWLTEKTLLREPKGIIFRIIIGIIMLVISGIFWWVILAPPPAP